MGVVSKTFQFHISYTLQKLHKVHDYLRNKDRWSKQILIGPDAIKTIIDGK